MGLSVSASTGIVLISLILIFGTLYPAIQKSEDMKNDAREEWLDWREEKQQAGMNITEVRYEDHELNITLTNTGDTIMDIRELEVMLNGNYSTDKIEDQVVDEEIENTNIWNPGQKLTLSLENVDEDINRVAIVNEFGSIIYHSMESD